MPVKICIEELIVGVMPIGTIGFGVVFPDYAIEEEKKQDAKKGLTPKSVGSRYGPNYQKMFLFDLKHMDDREHRRLTGVSNKLIHSNLRLLAEMNKNIQIRVPLIHGYNDMDDNILATVKFVSSLGITRIAFLPYNKMAGSKYTWMGKKYTLEGLKPQTLKDLDHIRKIAVDHNLEVQIGG